MSLGRDSLTQLIARIRSLIERLLGFTRENFPVLLAIGGIILGLLLALLSVLPDVELIGSAALSVSVPAFSERNESFRSDASLAEITLRSESCAWFVTFLDERQFEEFLATGERPSVQLDCERRVVSFQRALHWVIVENRGALDRTLDLSAAFYSVRFPRALLALPALPLMLGSTVFLLLRWFRRSISQLRADFPKK